MTTLTTPATPASSLVESGGEPDADQVVELRGVGWAGYKTIARLRHGRSRPKLIYLDGDLTLVSPGQPHERLNVQVRRFFDEVVMSLRIPTFALGQMTWRRRKKEIAVEGDQTYYIANEHRVRGKKIDLRVDPPPDLAIEVVVTNKADHALEVYARLGVPEVWVCEENQVRVLVLGANGEYNQVTQSLALPFLSAVEIFEQSRQPIGLSDLDYIDRLRRWVRDVLVPRVSPP